MAKKIFRLITTVEIPIIFVVVFLRILLFLNVKTGIPVTIANSLVAGVFTLALLTYIAVLIYSSFKIMNNPTAAIRLRDKLKLFFKAIVKAPFKYDDFLRGDPKA